MKTKGQKGFTLLEVMIAISICAIMILAAGTVLVTGQTFWNRAWQEVNLQRDASYAMFRMSSAAKAATSAKVESEGAALRIYREEGWIRFFLSPGTKEFNLKYEGGAGDTETILNDSVGNLQFNVEGNKVTILLELNKDNLQTHLVSTVMMRNYGG